MTIGMREQAFDDCELACCVCGNQDKLVVTAFRKNEKVTGYLFVCNSPAPTQSCFDTLQRNGFQIAGNPDAVIEEGTDG